MISPDIIARLREELAREIQSHSPPAPRPLPISPWLAMSLLQKAIRRGHEEFALQAAATLLDQAPDRFWRRAAIIAFEDVGIADLEAIGLAVASLAGKRFRAQLGGEWVVASFVTQRLVNADKCRAADDLVSVIERYPLHEQSRLGLTYEALPHLIRTATSDAPLPVRALATWYAIGTDRCRSDYLRIRRGAPQAFFDTLLEMGYPLTTVEIAREGFRRTNQILCPFLPLLASEKQDEPRLVTDDAMPPEKMCGPLPSWALDMFSRPGRKALKLFLGQNCGSARWVRTHAPRSKQIDLFGNILFGVESSLMKRRYRWRGGEELRRLAETECQGPFCPDATEVMDLLRDDIHILNEVRSHVL